MEELNISLDELEEIEKFLRSPKFNFPAITVGKERIYFNRSCAPFLKDAVKWFASTDYIVGVPAKRSGKNSFAITNKKIGDCLFYSATFPVALKMEKKLQPGCYKLYKYKDGFAFKRYEPIAEN